nr:MAG TPA: Protein of unknown function (DUF1684) [Caudoviricetes sp.]
MRAAIRPLFYCFLWRIIWPVCAFNPFAVCLHG